MTHEERVYFRIEAAISHEEKINHKYRMWIAQSYTAATSQEESDDEENKTHDGQ